jgi:L-amino acid N-acyltransferase YncA
MSTRCFHTGGFYNNGTHGSMAVVDLKGMRKIGCCRSLGTKNRLWLQTCRLPTTLQAGEAGGQAWQLWWVPLVCDYCSVC